MIIYEITFSLDNLRGIFHQDRIAGIKAHMQKLGISAYAIAKTDIEKMHSANPKDYEVVAEVNYKHWSKDA